MLIELRNKTTGTTFTGTKIQETDYGWFLQVRDDSLWFNRCEYEFVQEYVIS